MITLVVMAIMMSALLILVGFSIDESKTTAGTFSISNLIFKNIGFDYENDFTDDLTDILIAGAGIGIAIGFLTKTSSENYVILPFIVTILFVFVGTFFEVVLLSSGFDNFIRIPLGLLGLTFVVTYIMTTAEWFRGNI